MRRVFAILCLVSLGLAGCSLPEDVRFTNQTDQSLYVHLALPYPAYEMLNNHYRYSVRIEPGESWSTDDASRDDRADLEMLQINDVAIFRLYQYGDESWTGYALHSKIILYEIDPVHITVNVDDDGEFVVDASSAEYAEVFATPIDDTEWFGRP